MRIIYTSLDKAKQMYVKHISRLPLASNRASHIYEDKAGTIWLLYQSKELNHVQRAGFILLRRDVGAIIKFFCISLRSHRGFFFQLQFLPCSFEQFLALVEVELIAISAPA
jgi:hypothetical protein